MSTQRPPSGTTIQKGTSAIYLSKGSSFSFTPEQKISTKEWIDHGLAILNLAQQHHPEQGVGGDTIFSNKFQVQTASLQNLKFESSTQNDDQIEQLSIRVLVRVILCLGNYQSQIRSKAVSSIIQLAEIIQDNAFTATPYINQFETIDLGYAQCVANLFRYVGPSYSLFAMPLLAGLEMYQTHTDWKISTICTSAISQILWECKDKLKPQDKTSVIWALFFALGAKIEQVYASSSRLSIINGLLLLVPLYASDHELSSSIIRELLILSNKTSTEESSIKSTIIAIFDYNLQNHVENSGKKSPIDAYYAVLLELISSQVECAYDLLSWTVETFFKKNSPKSTSTAAPESAEINAPKHVSLSSNFSAALSNYFKASPALIRYGAALALNSISSLHSNFAAQNPNIWNYIVSGISDSDFLTAGLYLQLLECIDFGIDGPVIKQLVSEIKQDSIQNQSYDDIFISTGIVKEQNSEVKSDLVEAVAKVAPPLTLADLHKIANTLDFLDSKMKLRQMRIIRAWCRKTAKLDIYLLKILIPLCASHDSEIQLEAMKIAEKMLPSFSSAPQVEVIYIWSYISKLLAPKNDEATLFAAFKLLAVFPYSQLNENAREEVLALLFSLSYHPLSETRATLYKFLGSMGEVWKSLNILHPILAHLLIAFGDDNPNNVSIILDQLILIGSSALGSVTGYLGKLRSAPKNSSFDQLRIYDTLSAYLLTSKLELRNIIDIAFSHARVDEVWAFYLHRVPENQLVRPEEYNYNLNRIQNPMWPALLFSKFSVPPPPLGEGIRREVLPSNPIGKRRFICGFMQCLLPSLGSFDPETRKPAAIAALLCCFKGPAGGSEILKGLLEYVTQHLLSSKYVTFQVSAIEILKSICRCKIPGLSESIFTQYIELCYEFLHNSPSHMIQVAILEFLEIFCLVFPKGVHSRLHEILDATRPFLGDRNPEVVESASKLYPIIFKCVSESSTAFYEEYLRKEMIMLTNLKSAESLADPLISHLTVDEVYRILELNITAYGLLLEAPNRSFENAQFLINFLNHEVARFRLAALNSIVCLTSCMTTPEIAVIFWITLPLFADLNPSIRLAWSRFRSSSMSLLLSRSNTLQAHPDDRSTFSNITWEELLNETPTVMAQAKSLTDITFTITELTPIQQNDLPIEDDGFHLPTISENLMSRFKQLVGSMAESLQINNQNLVLYQLEQYRDNPSLAPAMNLVLSEFACMHDDLFDETANVLLAQLTIEMDSSQAPVIESSIAGIRNILLNSRTMFKPIIDKLLEQQFLAEGELLVMIYVFDMLETISKSTLSDLCTNFCAIGGNIKHSDKKRTLALYLATEFSIVVGSDSAKSVLDALQIYLDSQISSEVREKLYRFAGRLYPVIGDKHILFKTMLAYSRKLLKSNISSHRSQALSIFRIFASTMQPDDCFSFLFKFLADPNKDIRIAARAAILEDQLMYKNWDVLKGLSPETPEREALMIAGKLPCMDIIGISSVIEEKESEDLFQELKGTAVMEGSTQIKLVEDPFNIQFYRSEQRKKITRHYKINEAKFAKCIEPATIGVFQSIENKINGVKGIPFAVSADDQTAALRDIRPLLILRALIPLAPAVAETIVLDLLHAIELFIDIKKLKDVDEEAKDLEMMILKIDLLSNFMIAYGTSRPDLTVGWLERIKAFITNATGLVGQLRNTLYQNMEKAFYFHNQYTDIPLISDEQIQALQDLRDMTQEAILDVVKSGKTEKVKLIDNRNDQWDQDADDQSDYLRTLNFVLLHILSGYSVYFILAKDLPEETISATFKFIVTLLDEEHRGIRYLAVESAVEMILRQESLTAKPILKQLLHETIVGVLEKLDKESSSLYRKKIDLIYLAAQLIHLIENDLLQNNLLKMMVSLWKDGDSEVRHFAIDLIPILGERGVKPVLEAFKDKSVRSAITDIDLVQELVILGNNPDYPDKPLLQGLLKWRYSSGLKIW